MPARPTEDIINEVVRSWVPYFAEQLERSASEINQNTGAGLDSFKADFRAATATAPVEIYVRFLDYLRFADMRRLNWNNMPPQGAIEDWIKSKGVENFKSGFSRARSIPKTDKKLIEAIAWGIRVKIKQRNRLKRKRTPWYNKKKWKHIWTMYGQMLDRLGKNYLEGMKQDFK